MHIFISLLYWQPVLKGDKLLTNRTIFHVVSNPQNCRWHPLKCLEIKPFIPSMSCWLPSSETQGQIIGLRERCNEQSWFKRASKLSLEPTSPQGLQECISKWGLFNGSHDQANTDLADSEAWLGWHTNQSDYFQGPGRSDLLSW